MKKNNLDRLYQWLDEKQGKQHPIRRAAHFVLRLLTITTTQLLRNKLSLRSSAMAYALLLSLVPMLAMSTAVVKGLGGGDQLRHIAYSYIETLEQSSGFSLSEQNYNKTTDTPENSQIEETAPATLTSYLRAAVDKIFAYVERTNFTTLGSFGVVGIFFTVLLMLNHVESAMNVIWQVEKGRSPMRKLSDYITLLVLLPLSINITLAASALLRYPTLSTKLDILLPFEWLQTLLFQGIPVFFIALSLFIMYIFFPNTKVKTVPAMLGALLASLLWFTVQNIYINLQVGVAKHNAIYGTFASAPLFLAWIYLGWIFILLGAQFAWSLQNIQEIHLLRHRDKPALQMAAAFDIVDLVYEKFQVNTPLKKENVADLLNYSTTLCNSLIKQLLKNNILYITQDGILLLPSQPDKSLLASKIITTILGEKTPHSAGGRKSQNIIDAAIASTKEYKEKQLELE